MEEGQVKRGCEWNWKAPVPEVSEFTAKLNRCYCLTVSYSDFIIIIIITFFRKQEWSADDTFVVHSPGFLLLLQR